MFCRLGFSVSDVPARAVEPQLLLEAGAQLLGAAREDVDRDAGAAELAQQRRRARAPCASGPARSNAVRTRSRSVSNSVRR